MASEHNGSGFGSFIGMFVLGAATGAAVALLTAPRSGKETRAWLKDTAEDLGESMERIPDALQRAGSRAVKAGQEAFGQAKDELTQVAYRTEDRLRSKAGAAADKFGK